MPLPDVKIPLVSPNVKVVLKQFIVRKHTNLKYQIPAFVRPFKCAEVATFAPTGN